MFLVNNVSKERCPSLYFLKNEYCWLSIYFISFLVYVSNRTMMWPFLMMWKLRFKKKSYTVSFSNLYIIEKSKCLLLTNWCVIDVKIKKKKNSLFIDVKIYYLLCDEVTLITITLCPKLLALYSILECPQFLSYF